MKIIGITGGVGAGKSQVLKYISEKYNCQIVLADDVGNQIKEPGEKCYDNLVALLGKDILDRNGFIDRQSMARVIFANSELLNQVNNIIHPAVIEKIKDLVEKAENEKKYDYFFIEAALLIECGFNDYVDEMWYIYADSETRRQRLKENRGYDDDKIDKIFSSQLSDDLFRENCDFVIDNSGNFSFACEQVDLKLR